MSVGSTNEKQLLNSKVMGSSKKLTLLCSRAERHTSSWIGRGRTATVIAHARTTSPRTASDQRYEWSDTCSGNIKALRQILTTSIQSIHIYLLLLQNLSAGLLPRRSASPTKSTSEDIGQKYHLSDGSVFLLSCTRTKSQAANLSKTTPLLLVYIQQVKRVRVYTSWQTFRKGPATPKANSRMRE